MNVYVSIEDLVFYEYDFPCWIQVDYTYRGICDMTLGLQVIHSGPNGKQTFLPKQMIMKGGNIPLGIFW